jgi:hypothetical protein
MNLFLTLALVLLVLSLQAFKINAQVPEADGESTSLAPTLIESYSRFKGDEASMIIDLLRNAVEKNRGSKGYIAVYCGKICKRGEIEAHIRGIRLALHFKRLDPRSFTVVAAGFKDVTTTEFWLVPEGACLPIDESEFDPKRVIYKGVFPSTIVKYDCC